jgi:hypothetical protein
VVLHCVCTDDYSTQKLSTGSNKNVADVIEYKWITVKTEESNKYLQEKQKVNASCEKSQNSAKITNRFKKARFKKTFNSVW